MGGMRDALLGLIAVLLVGLNVQVWILAGRIGQEAPITASCTVESAPPSGGVTDDTGGWVVRC